MTDDYEAIPPEIAISTARANLAFAIRVSSEVNAGRIRSTIFQRGVNIITDGIGVSLPPSPQLGKKAVEVASTNLIINALSATALVTDEALDLRFGKLSLDTERRGLRMMVHQFRNAFAHNPFRPTWRIKSHLLAAYTVNYGEAAPFVFDAAAVHDRQVRPIDVGGFEAWLKVLTYCEKIVALSES